MRIRRANGIREGDKDEVFGRCVKEIDVSIEAEYKGEWLCCEWKYLRLIWEAKAAQNRRYRWVMVSGIGCTFKCFLDTLGGIEELKSPPLSEETSCWTKYNTG